MLNSFTHYLAMNNIELPMSKCARSNLEHHLAYLFIRAARLWKIEIEIVKIENNKQGVMSVWRPRQRRWGIHVS